MRISDWSSDVCSSDLIDAQLAGVGDREQPRTAAAAGADQRADVSRARGDDAVERRDDAVEALCRAEPVDAGARGVFRSLLGGGIAGLLVDFLLRSRLAAEHRLPTRCRSFGKVGIG